MCPLPPGFGFACSSWLCGVSVGSKAVVGPTGPARLLCLRGHLQSGAHISACMALLCTLCPSPHSPPLPGGSRQQLWPHTLTVGPGMPQGCAHPARLGLAPLVDQLLSSPVCGVPPAPRGCIKGWDPSRDSLRPGLGAGIPPSPPWDAFDIVLPCAKPRLLLQAPQPKGFSCTSGSWVLWGRAHGRAPPELPNPLSRRARHRGTGQLAGAEALQGGLG